MKSKSYMEGLLLEDLILEALSYVEAKDLVHFQQTCQRFRNLSGTNDLWRVLCDLRWQAWPAYFCLNNNNNNNHRSDAIEGWANWTWMERYRWVEQDFRRTETTQEELEGLEWYFNFLPWAGGSSSGEGTRSLAYFHHGRLYLLKYLWMYPHLNYNLGNTNEVTNDDPRVADDDDEVDEDDFQERLEAILGEPLRQAARSAGASDPRPSRTQYVQISSFPRHYIARTSVGGWILWNENVVFFSGGAPREVELPDQLEMHIDMFRFA